MTWDLCVSYFLILSNLSIPVCTLSPSCNWHIDFRFLFSRVTFAEDGKHPPPPPLGGAVVIVVVVVVVVDSDADAAQQQCCLFPGKHLYRRTSYRIRYVGKLLVGQFLPHKHILWSNSNAHQCSRHTRNPLCNSEYRVEISRSNDFTILDTLFLDTLFHFPLQDFPSMH